MPQNYVPILLLFAVAVILIPAALLAARIIRAQRPNLVTPSECGIDHDISRSACTVRYYILAILFVVFGVGTILLFPWAVKCKALGVFGLIEMLIFLGVLIVGYFWAWKKGALEWV
jgi:NADH-quinone oxidoreductase subunit A